jgi:hypothetical protein
MTSRFNLVAGMALIVIAVTIVAPCSAEDGSLGRGLIAHWKFEDGAGDVVKDSSGRGNDGIIVPANTLEQKWGTGDFAGSVSFSGDNDHFVRIPPSASLNSLKKEITIIAFLYPRSLWAPPSYSQRIISKVQRQWRKAVHLAGTLLGATSGSEKTRYAPPTGYAAIVQRQWRATKHPDQYFLGYGPENGVLHYKWHVGLIGDEVSLYRLPKGEDKPRVGEWVHLAGTYDGQTGTMSLYVDGKRVGTQTRVG